MPQNPFTLNYPNFQLLLAFLACGFLALCVIAAIRRHHWREVAGLGMACIAAGGTGYCTLWAFDGALSTDTPFSIATGILASTMAIGLLVTAGITYARRSNLYFKATPHLFFLAATAFAIVACELWGDIAGYGNMWWQTENVLVWLLMAELVLLLFWALDWCYRNRTTVRAQAKELTARYRGSRTITTTVEETGPTHIVGLARRDRAA